MKKCDIFITATENDTCSNSLLEALSCGLPVIGFDSGGTTELISSGGKVYNDLDQLIPLIDEVSSDLESFKSNIKVDDMKTIGNKYYEFISKI